MKKLIWIVPAILLLLLTAVVFLLPSQPVVYRKISLHASQDGIVKLLTQKNKWQQWWPITQKGVIYDSANFSYQQQLLKSAIMHLPFQDSNLLAQMNTVMYSADSAGVIFQMALPASSNPLQKITNYFESRKLAGTAETILQNLKSFAEKEENIYGFSVRQERVKDTALVATRFETTGYPDPARLYDAVEELRRYIASQGAKETGSPMVHSEAGQNGQHQVMVALPVDSVLQGNGTIQPKRMIPGKILVTEVKGGPHTVQKAMQDFEQYVIDHRRTSPAIPYESLITNRLQEPDTSKWITRLSFPVM
ncbi:MAG TPA: hypothetical protein VGN63_06180 [Flavisolibacter sp.]|jgi:hypothetical protein|nr:hypothetical protein [Flavisolibacter sp.]